MGNIDKTSFIKLTNFKLFGFVVTSREEVYNETNSEGEAFQINVTQDYYNREFKDEKQN